MAVLFAFALQYCSVASAAESNTLRAPKNVVLVYISGENGEVTVLNNSDCILNGVALQVSADLKSVSKLKRKTPRPGAGKQNKRVSYFQSRGIPKRRVMKFDSSAALFGSGFRAEMIKILDAKVFGAVGIQKLLPVGMAEPDGAWSFMGRWNFQTTMNLINEGHEFSGTWELGKNPAAFLVENCENV